MRVDDALEDVKSVEDVQAPKSASLARPRKLEALSAGPVAISGPGGIVRHIQISAQDTPDAIEHCLRSVFRLERDSHLVLLNSADCAVPMGMGLLCQPGADGSSPSGAIYRLDVHQPIRKCDKPPDNGMVTAPQHANRTSRSHSVCSSVAQVAPIARTCFEMSVDKHDVDDGRLSIVPVARPLPVSNRCSDEHKVIAPAKVSLHEPPPGTVEEEWSRQSSPDESICLSGSLPFPVPDDKLTSEHTYWFEIAEGFRRFKSSLAGGMGRRASVASHCSQADSSAEEFLNVAAFDTSDMRIDSMFSQWAGSKPMTRTILADKLAKEHGVTVTMDGLSEGLRRIRQFMQVGDDDDNIARPVFGAFWQRLLIGAAYRRSFQKRGVCVEADRLQLVEYSEHHFEAESMTEEELLFRSPLRIIRKKKRSTEQPAIASRWVRCNSASADRLLRLGLKFYLHPLATGDAIAAGRNGMTKIDRHGHQYFVSLEVYVLDGMKTLYASENNDMTEPMKVGPNISRYGMFLVATGNPQGGHRDWLLSIISERSEGIQDPLDFFKSDSDAAKSILDKVQFDLEAHGQLREYQADYLLYTVIDRAASEFMPICLAYGHRLQWLQKSLKTLKLSLPEEYVDEVAKMQLEMQELKQWIGQIRSIVKTLNQDCKATGKQRMEFVQGCPWNFGAHAHGRGKSISMFLCKTEAHIDEMSDRLSTLGELASNFLDHHERHRDAFVNNILLTLTVATAVFMPAQLLAGIYGTNFVDVDGVPTIPELNWKYGYWYFLTASFLLIASGLSVAWYCLRRRR